MNACSLLEVFILQLLKINNMQQLSNFLLIWQFSLFIIILGNIARLLSNYLITKIK